VLGDYLAGGVFTATAAGTNGKLALNFEQRARTVIDGIADLTVTDGVANANVHGGPSSVPGPPERPLS